MTDDHTTAKDYSDALQVQDACNLSGVVYLFARIMERICAETRQSGTDAKNHHAIAVMFASKIASLTGSETADGFSAAYEECTRRSS